MPRGSSTSAAQHRIRIEDVASLPSPLFVKKKASPLDDAPLPITPRIANACYCLPVPLCGIAECLRQGRRRPPAAYEVIDHRREKQHDEDDEQDLRNSSGGSGDTTKTEYRRDDCNDQ